MSSVNPYMLRVPLDASQVPDFTPDRSVRVLASNRNGHAQQRLVTFNKQGKGTATFEFDLPPESLRVTLGPETATPHDIQHLETISLAVPISTWRSAADVTLPAIQISSYHWWWWQHWRQNFTIGGRVLSPAGLPLAHAMVSAFDIDAWWWWTAQEEVGQTTTDAHGFFTIEFARCSGWRPWWWWMTRDWQANPALVDKITSFVGTRPRFGMLPPATPTPSVEVFQTLLASAPRPIPLALSGSLFTTGQSIANTAIDPASLECLRERLIEILPRNFPFPIWPWSASSPWEDCGANLIFRVTETYGGQTTVRLNETVNDARWDIPSSLYVALTASEAGVCEEAPGWSLVDYLLLNHRSPMTGVSTRERAEVPPGMLA